MMPFLRNVTRGRNVPDDRLAEVAEQYHLFGGVSPINAQSRALVSALQDELRTHQIDMPVYWANRNWTPYLPDVMAQMAADGITRVWTFVPSAFSSYSGCGQYRDNLADAQTVIGLGAPRVEKLRLFYNHPGFIEPMADHLGQTIASSDAQRVVFTAHSIPESMAQRCPYAAQLHEAAGLIMDQLGNSLPWDLVYQSRSGPPQMPWLAPDIGDHLKALANDGVTEVVVCPLGFTSDHMEVQFDLDTQAAETAAAVGITYHRSPTVGTDPRFITMIRELIQERVSGEPIRALGAAGPWPNNCGPQGCRVPAGPPAARTRAS